MSYVKFAIVKDGVLDIFEVHGAELIMSTRKRILDEIATSEEIYSNRPSLKKEHIRYLKKCLKSAGKYNSGLVHERVRLGIAELDNEKQIENWLDYLKRNDIPAWADGNEGYPYNSALDINAKSFYSMVRNWYADYQSYLPDGWKYQELSVDEMNMLVLKYPVSERHRDKAKMLLEEMVASKDERNSLHIEALKKEYGFKD